MCLAIPGQIVEIADDRHVAKVEVSGVRRQVNRRPPRRSSPES